MQTGPGVKTAAESTTAVAEGAEALVELLNLEGVKYLFLNPGTDTFPVQEAIAKYRYLGKPTPEVITCLHEGVALAAAHGYFQATRRPQMVLVHVDCGTQNVGGALHNAQRDRAGIVFCAGRSPITSEGELRGSKNNPIHWWQEQRDQHGIVRNYVKWDYELRRNETIHRVMTRAFQLASTEPCGVVYLTLPRELLMEKLQGVKIPRVERHQAPLSPQADPEGIERAATWLLEAHYPLVLTAQLGRHPEAVPALVELAELLALPVIDSRLRMNFPSDHPLHLGYAASPYLEQADLLLLLDHDVPYLPALEQPHPEARVVQIDIDPVKEDYVTWEFPVDLAMEADVRKALPALLGAVRAQMNAHHKERIEARRRQVQEEHQRQRAAWRQTALSKAAQKPIAVEWLAHCLNQVLSEDTLVVNEAVTNATAINRYVVRSQPGSYFHSGGSSLGWGLGAALGVKLAHPERRVACVVGDGAFLFGHPVPALWAASVYRAPFLCVVLNNGEYYASKRPLQETYPEGYSAKSDLWLGTQFAPAPRYQLIAQGAHAYAETVEEPEQLLPALKRCLEQVDGGRAAVLDVVLETR